MSDMQSIRDGLRGRLSELMARHARIEAHLHPAEALPPDWQEQATELENDEVLTQLDESVREEITGLQGALRRIDAGTWGTCVKCGDDIPSGRMLAVPTATHCVRCAA